MSTSKPVPAYRHHKQSGQAIVTLTGTGGARRDVLLGRYGTLESRQEYARIITEWEVSGRQLPKKPGVLSDITVAELISRYWSFVKTYYRHPDGSETKEVSAFLYALRPLNHLYGTTLASCFGPLALKAVRDLMIRGYEHPKFGRQAALSRGVINQRIKRIRRMFRWATENELVESTVLHALEAVAGLRRGRSGAIEHDPVAPVSRAVVNDTLPLLRPMIADMVILQLECGMRSGELVTMRACDIDMSEKVWLYRPRQHKTAYHGHTRVIPIGPKGQAIVRRYLTTELQKPLFSPAASMAERSQTLRENRKSPVQPSQKNRRKKQPKKSPGEMYKPCAFSRSIADAIKRHNKRKPEHQRIPHWHPHQLRHTRALELKREAGLEAARAVLGHRSPVITEHYATLDVEKASEVMLKIG
jgi:integrase